MSFKTRAEEDEDAASKINPISGMLLSADGLKKNDDHLQLMSEEEKELEAEKLFVLFERMERAGISENPLRRALHEGKLEKYRDKAKDSD